MAAAMASPQRQPLLQRAEKGPIVRLNVYDIDSRGLPELNTATKRLGLGGLFHAGLEVNGLEWSYGKCDDGTGVFWCEPRANPFFHFRQTVHLGQTAMNDEEVRAVLRESMATWPGMAYDLLNRNCCHFSAHLSQELGTGALPDWVNKLARSGSMLMNVADVYAVAELRRRTSSGAARPAPIGPHGDGGTPADADAADVASNGSFHTGARAYGPISPSQKSTEDDSVTEPLLAAVRDSAASPPPPIGTMELAEFRSRVACQSVTLGIVALSFAWSLTMLVGLCLGGSLGGLSKRLVTQLALGGFAWNMSLWFCCVLLQGVHLYRLTETPVVDLSAV